MYIVHFERTVQGRREHKYSIVFFTFEAAERCVRKTIVRYPNVTATIFAAIAHAHSEPVKTAVKIDFL